VDERTWGAHGKEEEEQHEDGDDALQGHWRPGGLEEALEKVALPSGTAPDWRDEAFHGSSPAREIPSPPWQSGGAKLPAAETVEAVAVSTLEAKPADSPAPFSGNAWAAVTASGVEDKAAQSAETAEKEPEAEPEAEELSEAHKEAQPANNWFPTSSTPWETEARKASQLAATWDAPAVAAPVVEAAASHEGPVEKAATSAVDAAAALLSPAPAGEFHAPEATPGIVDAHAAAVLREATPDETQDIPVYKAPEPSWLAPAPVEEAPVVEPQAAKAPIPVAEPQAKQPDTDALVARVLEKLSPDVMQKVTHEILKPMIEALLKEELKSHKS